MQSGSPGGEKMRRERHYFAQKAGEALIAAMRATTGDERVRHRVEALHYAQMLRELSRRSSEAGQPGR